MKIISRLILMIIVSALLFSASTSVSISSGDYDPWADLDDDGDVDIFDIVDIAGKYGTKGDSTKNVNVTNWPRSRAAVEVFHHEPLVDGASSDSIEYNANGFRYMHILADTEILDAGESVDIELHSGIGVPAIRDVLCYTFTLTETFPETDIVLYVPSDNFYFRADAVGTTSVAVYLSFYLT
ncbi:MAG: hypothetical protein JSV35_04845 [Candidatus Bathyarchaeota archaeon]|nr:MAG: hypothetical protein JSV35_04845 [Candidatus Bathyarchaeota archaeon]